MDIQKRIIHLALRYYKTSDLGKLTPTQLDKITTWATNHSVVRGSNKDRRAGRVPGRFIK